jgi:hypothetical protein
MIKQWLWGYPVFGPTQNHEQIRHLFPPTDSGKHGPIFAIEESRSPLLGTIQAWFGAEGMLPVHRPFLPKKFACGPFNSIQCGNQEKLWSTNCWVSFWHSYPIATPKATCHPPAISPSFSFRRPCHSGLLAVPAGRASTLYWRGVHLHEFLTRFQMFPPSHCTCRMTIRHIHEFSRNFWTAGEGWASVNSINRKAKTMS